MEEIDNLKKYGSEFQSKCLASLVTDQRFVEQIFDILTPEYFESDANKWIVEQVMEYFIKYKSFPTLQVFGIKTDRKSTRLNSSHQIISYAVFCLKKKKVRSLIIIGLT